MTKLAELSDGRYSDFISDVCGKSLMIGLELMVNTGGNGQKEQLVHMPVE